MSRSLQRVEVTLSGTAFDDVIECPAGHKLEAIVLSRFLVATTGTVYFGILKAPSSFVFIDQLDLVAGRYVEVHNYEGVPLYEGEKFQVAFSGTGYVASSVLLAYIDVNFDT